MPPESPSPTELPHQGANRRLITFAEVPLPWRTGTVKYGVEILDWDGATTAWAINQDVANAIVCQVNAHPALLACADALRALIDTLDGLPLSPLGEEGSGKIERSIRAADAALAALPTEGAR